MNPETLFHRLLGLRTQWRVSELVYIADNTLEVNIMIEEAEYPFKKQSNDF